MNRSQPGFGFYRNLPTAFINPSRKTPLWKQYFGTGALALAAGSISRLIFRY
jgi:hypothetical protein